MSKLRVTDDKIELYNPTDGTAYLRSPNESGNNIEIPNGNLSLATGQAIEDGDGVNRINLRSNGTAIKDNTGVVGFEVRNDEFTDIVGRSGQPVRINDKEGNFTAVKYTSDPSTGTLELTNADLGLIDNTVKGIGDVRLNGKTFPDGEDQIRWENSLNSDDFGDAFGRQDSILGQSAGKYVADGSWEEIYKVYGQLLIINGKNTDDDGSSFTDYIATHRNTVGEVLSRQERNGPGERDYRVYGAHEFEISISDGGDRYLISVTSFGSTIP